MPANPTIRSVVWDLETTHLRADMGTLMAAGFLDLTDKTVALQTIDDQEGETVLQREGKLACWAAEQFTKADILVGQNSLGFDKNFLNGILGRQGQEPLPKRIHADCYLIARHGFKGLLQSYSLDNMADFFGIGIKDRPSKHDWRLANLMDPEAVERIKGRCEADLWLTAAVWGVLKPHWLRWRGQ